MKSERETIRYIGPNDFEDKTLQCVDCGESFVWTAGEQTYYSDKNLAPVKRCQACRERRRQTIHPPLGSDKIIAQAKSLFPNDYHQGVQQ